MYIGEDLEHVDERLGLLLVDDQRYILSALKRLFHRHGYAVHLADGGRQALEIMQKEQIAVVISDMKMPEMNGAELMTHITSRWPDVVKVALTGHSDLRDTISAINEAGIFRYVSKPWDDDVLLDIIEQAFAYYQSQLESRQDQENTHSQNEELKTRNVELTKEVEHNIIKLEQASTDLANAYEDERKLRKAQQEAEQLNATKTRFLASMSHEMRSPLNAVIAMNALLLESDLTEEQHQLAKLAHDGGQTLLALINDILDFSKIEADKLQLNSEWFNFTHLVENISELMASQTINKPVDVVSIIANNTPQEVYGDKTRLKQILFNLVNNAVKFTDQGGVSIHVSHQRITEQGNEKPVLIIEVKDTGIGISEEEQRKIFDEFFQADNSDTRLYGGTGLGLSICSRLVEMMEGTIEVSSTKGKGSCFRIQLPLETRNPLPIPQGNVRKFILIDTNNTVLFESIKAQLNEANVDVFNYSMAVENLTDYSNAVLMVDIKNANTTPHENIEKLYTFIDTQSQGHTFKKLDIIGMLSSDSITHIEALRRKGFNTLLRKPLRLNQLMHTVLDIPVDAAHNAFTPGQYCQLNTMVSVNESKKESKPPIAEKPLKEMSILLAEDSPANQAVVSAILKNKPYTLDIANNGVEALELAKKRPYHIILMDLAMPYMDGLACTQNIRQSENINQHTTIIAMTANAYPEDRERCFGAGMNDYISKPIDVKHFLTRLEHWSEVIDNTTEATSTPNPIETKKSKEDISVSESSEKEVESDYGETAHQESSENDQSNTTEELNSERTSEALTLIDEEVLHRLARDTSYKSIGSILSIYFSETDKRLTRMLEFFDAKQWQALGDEAHTLKSSSGSFGAVILQDKGRAIEHYVREKRYSDIDEPMQDIVDITQQSITQLKAFCNEHSQ